MDLKKLSLPFPEKDIEWRMARCGKTNGKFWGMALAYITARAAMDRLDEICGPENWKDSYEYIPEVGFICTLSIKVDGEWIAKQNGAEETNIEATKGGISGAFKRAAVNWGIGRYLYDLTESFVQVSQEKTGYSAQTKEKEYFNWLPPKLPNWALPPVSHDTTVPAPKKENPPTEAKPAFRNSPKPDDTAKEATQDEPLTNKTFAEIVKMSGDKKVNSKRVKEIVSLNWPETGGFIKRLTESQGKKLLHTIGAMK